MQIQRFCSALALLGIAACSGHSGDGAAALTPMPDDLPGVYSGDLPCSNCARIAATLWLRPDGRFFLRQTYVEADGGAAGSSSYGIGLWRWDETAARIVLEARGPERRLARLDADRLELVTASRAAHVLARDPRAPPFTDRLPLDGESAVVAGGATFKECITGLTWPVAADGAFIDLRRLHRLMNRSGRVTLTSVEAHLANAGAAESASETLVLDRVIELRPGAGC